MQRYVSRRAEEAERELAARNREDRALNDELMASEAFRRFLDRLADRYGYLVVPGEAAETVPPEGEVLEPAEEGMPLDEEPTDDEPAEGEPQEEAPAASPDDGAETAAPSDAYIPIYG